MKKLKINEYKALGLIIFMLLIVLYTPQISASKEKYYNGITKTVTLKNNNQDIANVKLLTPQIYYVPVGYTKIAEFEIDGKTDLNKFIDKVDAYDVRKGNSKKNIEFDYKYYTKVGTKEVDDIEYQCDGTYENLTSVCNYVKVGTHTEDVYGYLPYENKIKNEKIRIALFTTVNEGDRIEWIPTLNGVEVSEWAIYESARTENFTEDTPTPFSNNYPRGVCFQPNKELIITGYTLNTTNTATDCFMVDCCGYVDKCGAVIATGTITNNICTFTTYPQLNKGQNYSLSFHKPSASYSFNAYATDGINRTNLNQTIYAWGYIGLTTTTVYANQRYDIMNVTSQAVTNMTVELNVPLNNTPILTSVNVSFNCTVNSVYFIKNVSLWTNKSGLVLKHPDPPSSWYNHTFSFSYNVTESINWNCFVCDVNNVCKYAPSNFTNLASNFSEDAIYYKGNTTEGSVDLFSLNITISDADSIQGAKFFYNNTEYSASVNQMSSTKYQFFTNFAVPLVTAITNNQFWFEITLSNAKYNSTKYYQTVNNMNVDDCTTQKDIIYNMTLKDEEFQTILKYPAINKTTIEVYFKLLSTNYETVTEFNKTFNETNPVTICLNSTLMNQSQYYGNLIVRYVSDGYAPEFYNVQNYLINKSRLLNNISLMDLNSTKSTEFTIIVKDSDYVLIPNAIVQISRKYVGEGVYKIVEIPVTDIQGQTVGHFDTNGVLYSISVYSGGVLVGVFDNINVVCQDKLTQTCNLNLNALSNVNDFINFENYNNLNYKMVFNSSTRTTSVTFRTLDGETATMVLNSSMFDNYNNVTLCTSSLLSSSGNMNCLVPASYGNLTLTSCLYKDGALVGCEVYMIQQDARDVFGTDGFFMVFLLVVTLPLMFITSSIGMIIAVFIGIVLAGILVIYNGGTVIGALSSLMWMLIASGIIIWKITTRRGGGIG